MLLRALLVWVAIAGVETLHGIARVAWLAPRVGDFRARQLAVFTGSALIFGVAWLSIRWIAPRTVGGALRVGALWLALMLAFEVGLGRFVAGQSWQRLGEDYDVTRGGLLGFGMLALLVSPWIAARGRDVIGKRAS